MSVVRLENHIIYIRLTQNTYDLTGMSSACFNSQPGVQQSDRRTQLCDGTCAS